jgi:lipopolysaccharide/colanic/teichoic acid biosynthesis glycosyltransferase
VTRRAVDIALSSVAVVLMLPVMTVVALLVRWRLGSPVLFRQPRSGLGGREFTIVKFRTMRDERFPGEPDPARLGRLGRILRSTSLDELPQLWNVLRGQMSIVGPRPTLPEQVVHYSPHQRRRLEVRPGITGWAQVHGRNSLTWPERIELDVWYVDHRSLRLDLVILARTVLAVLRPHGVTADGGVNPGFPLPAQASVPERERAAESPAP